MNGRVAFLIVGVLALAGGIWLATSSPPVPDPAAMAPALPGPATPPAVAPRVETGQPPPERAEADRAPATSREPAAPARTTPQGFRGLAIDGRGQPLEGVQVYLIESAGNEPLALPLLLQQRLPSSPLATAATAADGTFEIGLPRAQDRTYELYLLSEQHATSRLGGLRMLAGQWHDVGAVTMVPGSTLRGRVTVAGLETPVPQAVVTVEVGTAFEDVALRSLPGGDQGLVANVDASGWYELRHAPSRGVVRVSAVAPGFARAVKTNVELNAEQPVQVDFELGPGLTLSGRVVDGLGSPVVEARVEAWPASSSAAPLLAETDREGRFVVQGLSEGPHRLRIAARGFHSAEQADVAAGSRDVEVRLEPRGRARVRVTTPSGNVVRSYQLAVRRYFAEHDQVGFVTDVPEQRVRLDGLTDAVEIDGLPRGTFVCLATADGFAATMSAPFEVSVTTGTVPQDVEIVLSPGSSLRGRVQDERGRPLAGASVATQPAGTAPDSPLWKLLGPALPDRITRRSATTGEDGGFVLDLLAPGTYQLLVMHADACQTVVPDVRIDGPGDQTLPPVTMPAGALVAGRATSGGRTAGQIKVVLTLATNGQEQLRLEAISDAEGRFRMPRRVPPGEYVLRAAVIGTAEPEAEIFRQLLQLQRSSITVTVAAGQDLVERNIDIPADN
jgi:protocatechuate 3,4-dioxygenase beta subunit